LAVTLNDKIAVYIETLAAAYPAIREIWLFGSRAAGTARSDSDWDFLAFADQPTLDALTANSSFNRPYIDLLVIFDGDRFRAPWIYDGKSKGGSLSGWEWTRISADEATYKANKLDPDDESCFDITTARAALVWPQRS
jgi:hypothetical protein